MDNSLEFLIDLILGVRVDESVVDILARAVLWGCVAVACLLAAHVLKQVSGQVLEQASEAHDGPVTSRVTDRTVLTRKLEPSPHESRFGFSRVPLRSLEASR